MRTLRWVTLVVAAAVAVGCGGDEPQEEPTPRAVSAQCQQAFEEADSNWHDPGRESEGEEGGLTREGPRAGSIRNLFPTLQSCDSTDEWFEAYRGAPMEATAELPASDVLRELCASASRSPDDDIDGGQVCEGVAINNELHPN